MNTATAGSLLRRVGRRLDTVVIESAGRGVDTTGGRRYRGGDSPPAPGSLRPSRTVPVVVAVIAAAIALVVVDGRGEPPPGPGEALVEVDGSAFVWRTDGATEVVIDRTRLGPGDRIEVRTGRAELELADEVRYRALSADSERAATHLEMARAPRLRAGALLVDHPVAGTLRSGAGEVRLSPGSIARVTRTTAVSVGVYRGRAALGSAGASQDLTALRSSDIVGGGEFTERRPLDYDADDEWDRQYLAPAIALDRELRPLVAGIQAGRLDATVLADRLRSVVNAPPSASGLATVLEERNDALDAAIGVAVAGTATEGSFARRWAQAIGFHDAGASWGLVAMDLGADPDAIIDALSRAVERTPAQLPEGALELASASDDASSDPPAGPGDADGVDDVDEGDGVDGGGAAEGGAGATEGGADGDGPAEGAGFGGASGGDGPGGGATEGDGSGGAAVGGPDPPSNESGAEGGAATATAPPGSPSSEPPTDPPAGQQAEPPLAPPPSTTVPSLPPPPTTVPSLPPPPTTVPSLPPPPTTVPSLPSTTVPSLPPPPTTVPSLPPPPTTVPSLPTDTTIVDALGQTADSLVTDLGAGDGHDQLGAVVDPDGLVSLDGR
ncbi:hypothetical protein BH23ACT2_BH23ACT2_30720 [soil metagenome]